MIIIIITITIIIVIITHPQKKATIIHLQFF